MEIKVKILKTKMTPEGEITEGKEIMMDEDLAKQFETQGFVKIISVSKSKKSKDKED